MVFRHSLIIFFSFGEITVLVSFSNNIMLESVSENSDFSDQLYLILYLNLTYQHNRKVVKITLSIAKLSKTMN